MKKLYIILGIILIITLGFYQYNPNQEKEKTVLEKVRIERIQILEKEIADIKKKLDVAKKNKEKVLRYKPLRFEIDKKNQLKHTENVIKILTEELNKLEKEHSDLTYDLTDN